MTNNVTSKIGIIITTFERDELLYKSVESLLENKCSNFELIIVDQGNISPEKQEWILNNNLINNYYYIQYNSGLSFCRNYGVKIATQKQCEYVLMGSDGFIFNNSIQYINYYIDNNLFNYNLVGFQLKNCVCDWEANLNLIPYQHFELDFIEKKYQSFYVLPIKCDIVRNFFLAKTDSLLNVQWDNNLKLREHEDFFWRFKQAGYKVGWTNYIYAEKMTERPNQYKKLRQKNMQEGLEYLKKKYNIQKWIQYKNVERTKFNEK